MGSMNRKTAGGRVVDETLINATREQQTSVSGAHWRKHASAALIAVAVAAIAAPVTAEEPETPEPASAESAPAAPQIAEAAHDFSIPAGPLSDALHRFSEQSGVQVFFESELVNEISAPALNGNLAVQDALATLLAGSGLVYEFVNSKTLILRRSPNAAAEGDGATTADTATALAAGTLIPSDDITTESVTSTKRGGIEEVIVTARRREESVQSVPIAISALTSEDMKSFGIRNVGDMEGIVPGLNMGGGGNGLKKDSNPFIRGVGQRETKVTLDPGVGSYIDGIYLARTGGALLDTVGMERVEVLRGPQGTLFGRNAVGGSIAFTTIKPQPGLSGSLSSNVGNYGRSDVMAVANIPLIGDTLLSRITLSSKNSDGYFTNVIDNSTWGNDNRITGIGQVRWLPTDSLTFDLLAERTRVRETPRPSKCAVVRPINETGSSAPYLLGPQLRDPITNAVLRDPVTNLPLRGPSTVNNNYNPSYFHPLPIRNLNLNRLSYGNPNGRKSFHDLCAESEALPTDQFASDFAVGEDADGHDILQQGRYWIDTRTVGLTSTWDIGDIGPLRNTQFKSISAWREVNQIADEDLDAVPISQLLRVQDGFNESWQISQELQLTGATMNDRLFFSTGLYYFKEETPQDILIRTAGLGQSALYSGPNPDLQGRYNAVALEATRETLETDNQAYAWYGQVDFKLTPQVELTAGLRYTYEERWSAYSKAYAVGASMITGDLFFHPGINGFQIGNDWSNTPINSAQPGLANIQDWAFYSAEHPFANDVLGIGVPGYEGISKTLGGNNAYARKDASTSDAAWTPMASLKYHADEALLGALKLNQAMAYVTYSAGFGAGGVTAGAVDFTSGSSFIRIEDPVIFKPQHVQNYEIGLKLQGLDRRLQANIAVFHTDYKDMQITSTADRAGVPIPFIDNVGKSVIRGFEGEFIFLPTMDWRVVLNATYTDADIKEWNSRVIKLDPISGAPPSSSYQGDYATVSRDDEPMPRVPEWQAYLMTDYTFRLPGGSVLVPSIAARYTSEIYHGFDRGSYCWTIGRCNINLQNDEAIGVTDPVYSSPQTAGAASSTLSDEVIFVDARVAWISGGGNMELAAWVKNLTDKQDYLVGAIPLVDTTGTVGQIFADPRTFGLTMTYNFGTQ